jgi:hypothetical protein
VNFSTVKYGKETRETPVQSDRDSSWQGIGTGLALVMWGYGILIAGGILGSGLLWLAADGGRLLPWLGPWIGDRGTLVLLGVLSLGGTALLSYGLVLAGQWWCLMKAPQQGGGKQFLCICLTTVVLALTLTVVGAYQDGSPTSTAWQRGAAELAHLNPSSPGNLLLVASAALGLFGSLIFSQFLRNAASYFNDRSRMQRVDFNLTCVGVLLGGSVGAMICAHRFAFRPDVMPWLAGGWLVCLAWHLLLVRSVRRCVKDGLLAGVEDEVSEPLASPRVPAPTTMPGAITMHTLSGLRRLASKADYRG